MNIISIITIKVAIITIFISICVVLFLPFTVYFLLNRSCKVGKLKDWLKIVYFENIDRRDDERT